MREAKVSIETKIAKARIGLHAAIDGRCQIELGNGAKLIGAAREEMSRKFAFFNRSIGQQFRWIKFRHNGGK